MSTPDFTKMVPGFEFLQRMFQNAGVGAGVPNMSQWIAPTLDPKEVDKRINELRTVQFWLEQNSRMLETTIKALEVQRMTLATFETMNMPMDELRSKFRLDPEPAAAPPARTPVRVEEEEEEAPTAEQTAEQKAEKKTSGRRKNGAEGDTPAGVVDPMLWWSALTKQFGEIAAAALKDMPVTPGAEGVEPSAMDVATPADAAAKKKAPRRARSGS